MLSIQLMLEAAMVGLYTLALYTILHYFIQNKYVLLYVLGFLKHFLSFYLGIHNFYCNNGYACKKILHNHTIYKSQNKYLVIESLLEGVWFLIAGCIVTGLVNKNKWFLSIFVFGFVTHLISELFYIHGYFCNYNCRIIIE